MAHLNIKFESVTPLLLDSRYLRNGDTIRASAVIGTLRFWLRALCGYSYRQADTALFGRKGMKASVRVRILASTTRKKKDLHTTLLYLACGMQRYRCFSAGSDFIMDFSIDDEVKKKLLCCALKGLMFFGGLGARARRGFGAVRLSVDDGDNPFELPKTSEELSTSIQSLLKEAVVLSASFGKGEGLPSVSFAAKETEIYISSRVYPDGESALIHGGGLLRRWRSHTCSRDALKDHNLVYEFARTERIDNVPFRAIFGLPHYYFLRNLGNGEQASVTFEPAGAVRRITRRASPLLLSVAPLADGRASLLFILFRSQFMPRSVPIKVHGFRQRNREKKRLPTKLLGRHPSWRVALLFTDMLVTSGEFNSIRPPQTGMSDRSDE